MADGEYRGLIHRNSADLAAWLAKRPRRGGAGARPADHRSAPPPVGRPAPRSRPLLPARAAGGHRRRPQHRLDGVPRMPGDVPRHRAGRDEARGRGRVRERRRRHERLRPVRQDARLRGDHRLGRPDAGRPRARRCWRPRSPWPAAASAACATARRGTKARRASMSRGRSPATACSMRSSAKASPSSASSGSPSIPGTSFRSFPTCWISPAPFPGRPSSSIMSAAISASASMPAGRRKPCRSGRRTCRTWPGAPTSSSSWAGSA